MPKKIKQKSKDQIETIPFLPSRVSKDKDDIVREIEKLHHDFLENARNHLIIAKKIGEILEKKKSEVKHGEWEIWVEENLSFSIRSVQYYMKIHKHWNTLINTPNRSVGLLTEAIELITEKRYLDSQDVSEKLKLEKREHRKDIISLHRRFFKKGESLNKRDKTALQENKKQIKKVLDSLNV